MSIYCDAFSWRICYNICSFLDCGSYIRLVEDDVFEILFSATDRGERIPFSRINPAERKISDLQHRFFVEDTFNMVSGRVERMLFVNINGVKLIYPRVSESEKIIAFYYTA